MVKEEIWSVPIERARGFFREQPGAVEHTPDVYQCGSCQIRLTRLEPAGVGIWSSKRIRLYLAGEDAEAAALYRRFLIQFLTAGG